MRARFFHALVTMVTRAYCVTRAPGDLFCDCDIIHDTMRMYLLSHIVQSTLSSEAPTPLSLCTLGA